MNVRHVVEKPDGSIVFQGVIEGAELAFVIESGLTMIMENGIAPFVSLQSVKLHDLHDRPEEVQ